MFDFEKELNKDAEKDKGKVVKGAFSLTFNKIRDNKESIKKKTLFLKKRERVIIIHQMCIICKRPACKKLKACYYTFPEIVFKGGALLARA